MAAKRMRMCKRIQNINDLPDEVLTHTVSFLSIKEAVRTSILSTRWKYLFTLLSNLDIDMDIDGKERKLFMKFVDRLLYYRDPPSILRFRFQCHRQQTSDPQGPVSLLICAAPLAEGYNTRSKISDGPLSLFPCESLVILKVKKNLTQFPTTICLQHVKVLHFHAIVFPNDGTEKGLLSSCPVLEDLVLYGCVFSSVCVKFDVFNQNLKRLTLACISSGERKRPVDILINAPNLIFLSYSISSDYSLQLLDAKSLATAVLDSSSLVSDGGYDTAASDALGPIRNIQTLTVNHSVLQVLQRCEVAIPVFDQLTCLKISGWEFMLDSICLENILARCVVLETLVFEEPSLRSKVLDDCIQYSLQNSRLDALLRHLKRIEIKLFDVQQAEALMKVMGFFLENGKVLKDLIIYSRRTHWTRASIITNQLMWFRRRSRVLFKLLK
ncbi:hypothetical protein OROMI_031669 [Orobanche minor]